MRTDEIFFKKMQNLWCKSFNKFAIEEMCKMCEAEKMRCYKCNQKCVTIYWHNDRVLGGIDFRAGTKITHVNSACTVCEWNSHKTQIPEKID